MGTDPFADAVHRYAQPDEVDALAASVLARLEWRRRRGFKECSTCHDHLAPDRFGVDSRERDGLHRVCRSCRATS